jgi:hypothetical protein
MPAENREPLRRPVVWRAGGVNNGGPASGLIAEMQGPATTARAGKQAARRQIITGEDETATVRAQAILDDLIAQRRRLRTSRADHGVLEANRLAIGYWRQWLTQARHTDRGASA